MSPICGHKRRVRVPRTHSSFDNMSLSVVGSRVWKSYLRQDINYEQFKCTGNRKYLCSELTISQRIATICTLEIYLLTYLLTVWVYDKELICNMYTRSSSYSIRTSSQRILISSLGIKARRNRSFSRRGLMIFLISVISSGYFFSVSSATIGPHRTELNQNLPRLREWVWFKKVGYV